MAVHRKKHLAIAKEIMGLAAILCLLLAACDGDVEVTNVREQAGELAVTVIRKGEADQGSVTLVFAKSPLALRRWSVVDAQGLVTHIVLQDVETGGKLDSELFRWRDPQTYGLPD